MAKRGIRELLKKADLPAFTQNFGEATIISFMPPLIIWFFIGYWILNGAEFPFRPFFIFGLRVFEIYPSAENG